MLLKFYYRLSNVGVSSQLDHSSARYVTLTNRFGIISGIISFSILVLLFVQIPNVGWSITRILIAISGLLFFSVLLINYYHHFKLSKWIISWLPAFLIVYISISDKIYASELITIKDFFNYRFLLMAATIVPLLVFSTGEIISLLLCLFRSNRPPVPKHSVHLFRTIPSTRSEGNHPVIPKLTVEVVGV